MVKDLVRNFLSVQAEDGSIDWKPGLGGQRSRLLAPPLLASLVWRIYRHTEDSAFLEETLTPLQRFFLSWFDPPATTGMAMASLNGIILCKLGWITTRSIQPGRPFSLGVDISSAESPSLCALALRRMPIPAADRRHRPGGLSELPGLPIWHRRSKNASKPPGTPKKPAISMSTVTPTRRSLGELILEVKGSGSFLIQRSFPNPRPPVIQVRTDETIRRRPLLFLHGKNMSGDRRVERINDDQFRWIPGLGQLTGKYVYSYLERLEVRHLEPEDQITIHSVHFHTTDVTSLAPLWAGIPDPERAGKLVEQTITNPSLSGAALACLPARALPSKSTRRPVGA